MNFKAKGELTNDFTTISRTQNGGEYAMYIKDGDGPMDVFAVAYSGCIGMCAKGYYFRTYEIIDVPIEVEVDFDYDNLSCIANIYINIAEDKLTDKDKQRVLDNIKLRCKISHILKDEIKTT